jgi:hypothetical protein
LPLQEAIIVLRRVVLICLTVFLRNSSNGFSLITVANLLFLLSQLYLLPFEDSGDNQRENLTLAILTLCTSLLTQAPRPLPLNYAIPLSLLVIFTALGLVFSILATKLCKKRTNRTVTASGLEAKKGNDPAMEVEMPMLTTKDAFALNSPLTSSSVPLPNLASSSDPVAHTPVANASVQATHDDQVVPFQPRVDAIVLVPTARPSSPNASSASSSASLPTTTIISSIPITPLPQSS